MKRQHLNLVDLVQYGIKNRCDSYQFIRMFSPHAWSGNLGRRDLAESYDGGLQDEMLMIRKFYKKYPEVKYMPMTGPIWHEHGG